MNSNDKKSGIFVPARFIPTPRTVSPQAQAFLSSSPPVGQTTPPDLSDKAAWRLYAEEANRMLTTFTAMMARAHPADITTHELVNSRLYEIVPHTLSDPNERGVILYLHGGGFLMGGGQAAANAAMQIAGIAKRRTYSLDYRMAPDHPFPAALDDALETYRWLLERHEPESIAFYGPSAGGNLLAACLLKARDLGMPMPVACAIHSPAADLTQSGDTYATNETIDIVLKHRSDDLIALYLNGHDPKDPLASPVFGNFKEFPPSILTSGTRDLLLSSTVMLHRMMRRAGVHAELHVWEAMTHAPFFGAPEETELLEEQIQFLLRRMAAH